MNVSQVKIFSVMKEQMRYLSERQGVLSANIANLDVPNAKAMDVAAPDFARMAGLSASGKTKLAMTGSNPKHIGQSAGGTASLEAEAQRKTYEARPTKNNIVLEEQMMKVAQTSAQYQQTTATYRKMTELYKLALGKNQ